MTAPLASQPVLLENGRVALKVDVAFGARVTSLVDRATGRDWLLAGPRARDTSDDAVYRGEASRGWDECFPTVLPCPSPHWGRHLRDHGMLWGRAFAVMDRGPGHLTTALADEGIRFTRRLTLGDAGVTADYAIRSNRADRAPYLWSQHCVLAVTEGDRITLAGPGSMTAEGVDYAWPHHPARDLSRVGARDEGFVLKSYGLTPAAGFAQVSGPQGGLRFDWQGPGVPALGLWLDYGGWPEEAPLHQVAIEPTSAAADDLAGALALGQARWLDPDETQEWSVRLTLTDPEEGDRP